MFTVAEILKVTSGKLLQGSASLRVRGVSSDTRRVKRGDLFIAIKGDTFDGNDFTSQAVAGGASVLLICREDAYLPAGVTIILVKDTCRALGYLARHHRLKFKIPVIAITGSAGKTTTKEFIAAVLGKKYRVLYNKGTENNHIGVPMTLLQLKKRHQAAVIEAGTNHFGEINWLGEVTCPTVAVFTNIGQSHLAGLLDPSGVFREKVTLIDHVMKKGALIVNVDDEYLRRILKRKLTQKIITFAMSREADIKVVDVIPYRSGLKVVLKDGSVFLLPTPVWGNVSNALAAISCGQLLRVPDKDIMQVLQRVKPAKGRQCFHAVRGMTLIDDTYNANVVSYKNAIKTLSLVRRRKGGCLFLVAADMLELGDQSEILHAEVGEAVAQAGIDHVVTIGRWAGLIGERAKQLAPFIRVKHYMKQEDIYQDLTRHLRPGDVVLVKGSRGMRMDQLIEQLLKD